LRQVDHRRALPRPLLLGHRLVRDQIFTKRVLDVLHVTPLGSRVRSGPGEAAMSVRIKFAWTLLGTIIFAIAVVNLANAGSLENAH
jgi:hypothetical protein